MVCLGAMTLLTMDLSRVYMCTSMSMCVCVCVCVCARARMCVCMCVGVCGCVTRKFLWQPYM